MPEQRQFLTNPDEFTDVSRGNPQPHKLKGDASNKARLTAETWRLEIEAEGEAKIDHPRRIAAGTALDMPALLALGDKHGVKFLKAMQCNNIAQPLGQGLWEGVPLRQVLRTAGKMRERPPRLLLGLPQQRPQADVPIVAGDQPGAGYPARRAAPVHRLSAQRPADPTRARRAGAHAHSLGPRLQVGQMAPAHHAHQRLQGQ